MKKLTIYWNCRSRIVKIFAKSKLASYFVGLERCGYITLDLNISQKVEQNRGSDSFIYCVYTLQSLSLYLLVLQYYNNFREKVGLGLVVNLVVNLPIIVLANKYIDVSQATIFLYNSVIIYTEVYIWPQGIGNLAQLFVVKGFAFLFAFAFGRFLVLLGSCLGLYFGLVRVDIAYRI